MSCDAPPLIGLRCFITRMTFQKVQYLPVYQQQRKALVSKAELGHLTCSRHLQMVSVVLIIQFDAA